MHLELDVNPSQLLPPELKEAINKLVEPHTVGNPENPLIWTTKSLRHLQSQLSEQGFNVSHTTVGSILVELGYTYLSKFDNVSIIVRDNREINTIARQCINPYSVIVVLSCFYRIKRT